MKALLLGLALAATLPWSAQAQMSHSAPTVPVSPATPFGMSPVDDEHIFYHAMLSELEGRFGATNSLRWQGEAWAGTDSHRLWLKSEGRLTNGEVDDGQQQLFYSHPISTYFDAQIGARYDLDSLPGRGWGAIGIEGMAPLFFHVAATGYIGGEGRLAAKLEGSYDLLLTQKLILQPQLEMNFYSLDDPARRTGSGLSDVDAGLRLRYEITRKLAPYIGVTYDGKVGSTAALARDAGEPTSQVRFTLGMRAWF